MLLLARHLLLVEVFALEDWRARRKLGGLLIRPEAWSSKKECAHSASCCSACSAYFGLSLIQRKTCTHTPQALLLSIIRDIIESLTKAFRGRHTWHVRGALLWGIFRYREICAFSRNWDKCHSQGIQFNSINGSLSAAERQSDKEIESQNHGEHSSGWGFLWKAGAEQVWLCDSSKLPKQPLFGKFWGV